MKRFTVLLLAAAALGIGAAAGYAASPFGDVPDDHPFGDDIAWLEAAGVTLGCRDAPSMAFCPGDDVTRGQMAAFLRRLAESGAVDAGTLEGLTLDEILSRAGPQGPAGPAGPTGAVGPAGPTGPVGGIDVWDALTNTRVGTLLGYDHQSDELSYLTDAGDIETDTRTGIPPGTTTLHTVYRDGPGCTGGAWLGAPQPIGTYVLSAGGDLYQVVGAGEAHSTEAASFGPGVCIAQNFSGTMYLLEPAEWVLYELVPRS